MQSETEGEPSRGGRLGPEFPKLWAASAASNLGDGVALVAAPLLAATLTHDPALVAGLAFAQRLPWLLFALVSGALADRLDRRRTMATVGAGRAALIGLLGVAVLLDLATIPLLYVVFFLLGIGETLFDTASATVLPALVPPLLQFSIRFHPLSATSPNIVDSLVMLTGRLDAATIVAAGRANRAAAPRDISELLGACVRMAVLTAAQLHRRKLWLAYSSLHATRERLLTLFARCHGAPRPYHALEAADDAMRARFIPTIPSSTLPSVQQAFLHLLDVLEQDLEEIGAGQVRLTAAQRDVLYRLRRRQADLDLSDS